VIHAQAPADPTTQHGNQLDRFLQALGTNPKTSLRRHCQRVENGGATEAVAAWMGF
jgi:hypothetical protein